MRKERETEQRSGYSPLRTAIILSLLMGGAMFAVTYTDEVYEATQEAQVEDLRGMEAFIDQQWVIEPPPLEIAALEGVQVETEISAEYLRQMETQFVTEVNMWREAQGLPAFETRLTVLDTAAEIHSQFIAETNPVPLTHNTDFGWLSANYPTEVQVLGITDDSLIRTRDRVELASLLETGNTENNYGANGGIADLIVDNAQSAGVALSALLNSEPHNLALSQSDYVDIGINAQVNSSGKISTVIVLGRGGNGYNWPENNYVDMTGLDNHVYLPAIMNK